LFCFTHDDDGVFWEEAEEEVLMSLSFVPFEEVLEGGAVDGELRATLVVCL
jgi:hypothetical protein